ncbi:MAGE family member F1 [Ictidomys tridecemlineatus]|uniref:melanoma-associated antigen F1 n=1 Tax=Ictidomys tridecemlineatus TaxID=43179 RepID=UPI00038C57A0|nr:melanoma-associated antigen F1 [Ictidomys tridecemlineatus]KAG3271158.1 MAGE family member F1 [Ictidomys tridecemlineatus]
MLREPESRGLPSPQAAGEQHGGQDGETVALTVSQELAPSPLLQESIKEGLGAMREGAAEPAPTRQGARTLAAKALARRRAYRRLNRTVAEVVQFLLVKDKKKSPVTRFEMVKYVVGDLKDLFPEIIARAAEHLRYVFGFELKQLDRKHHTYILIHKLKPLEEEEDLGGDGPRLGLLMMILGLIYMKGNSVREAQVWDMLRRLGVLPSKYHFLFGYPKRLIMEEFVQQRYLNYRRVPHTNPLEYEFSWGPRSSLEISKMKVLGFVARLHKKEPQHWTVQYREALADEADRARAEASMRARVRARASARAGLHH